MNFESSEHLVVPVRPRGMGRIQSRDVASIPVSSISYRFEGPIHQETSEERAEGPFDVRDDIKLHLSPRLNFK